MNSRDGLMINGTDKPREISLDGLGVYCGKFVTLISKFLNLFCMQLTDKCFITGSTRQVLIPESKEGKGLHSRELNWTC